MRLFIDTDAATLTTGESRSLDLYGKRPSSSSPGSGLRPVEIGTIPYTFTWMGGIMGLVHDMPRGQPTWRSDNPARAARDFAARHKNFVIETPGWAFNESSLDRPLTAWPDAWLKRLR